MMINVSKAKGSYIFDENGKKYLDFVAGVSACSLGHTNKKITNSIKKQLDKYLHVMVYGEFITGPSLKLAKLLAKIFLKTCNVLILLTLELKHLKGL